MAFGYIRVRNLSPSSIGSTEIHNARLYEKGKFPENIKEGKLHYNQYYQGETEAPEGKKLKAVIFDRLAEKGVTLKKNQNCAIEFIVSASNDFFKGNEKNDGQNPDAFFSRAYMWLEGRYGIGSVVARSEHYDESNPHCHFIVVPIVEKSIKWKNERGEGVRKENRMNIREITGNKRLLRGLQDDYFKFVEPYGQRAGVVFQRGVHKARDLYDNYVKKTDYKMGELRAKLADLKNEVEKAEVLLEIKQEVAKIEAGLSAMGMLKDMEERDKKKNWEKGIGLDRKFRRSEDGNFEKKYGLPKIPSSSEDKWVMIEKGRNDPSPMIEFLRVHKDMVPENENVISKEDARIIKEENLHEASFKVDTSIDQDQERGYTPGR